MGVDKEDWAHLETYNQECARGIVHTQEWRERMAREQERFDWYARDATGMTQPRLAPPPPPPPVVVRSARDLSYKTRLGTTTGFEFNWEGVRPFLYAAVGAIAGAVTVLLFTSP